MDEVQSQRTTVGANKTQSPEGREKRDSQQPTAAEAGSSAGKEGEAKRP